MVSSYRVIGAGEDWVVVDGVRYANLPAGGLADGLGGLLDRVADRFDRAEGTVLLSAPAAAALGLGGPDDVRDALGRAGWKVGEVTAWCSPWRNAAPRQGRTAATVHVCVLPWVTASAESAEKWPWGRELADAAAAGEGAVASDALGELAWLLAEYDRLVGTPFRARAAVSGVAAIREQAVPPKQGKPPLWVTANGPHELVADRPLANWSRAETPAEAALGWRHRYDLSAAYLAAAGVAYLAREPLRPTGPRLFDPHACGYWLVPLAPLRELEAGFPLAPPLVDPTADVELVWLATPTVALAEELGLRLEIRDSWTAAGLRLLRGWSERLDAARLLTVSERRLNRVIKATYTEAVGLLRAPGGRVYRPDWHFTIAATSRANLLRKVFEYGAPEAGGRWPTEVDTDCLTYAADCKDWSDAAPAGMRLGDGLGQFHEKE